jgi:8-oxo-dGTP pyrophosphatase MutT (NUDIX family)
VVLGLVFNVGLCSGFISAKALVVFVAAPEAASWAEFSKGGSRNGETQLQTLKRELCEELGVSEFLHIKKIPAKLEFFDSARNKKVEMQAFLVELRANSKIRISKNKCKEHSSFKWVSKTQALKMLTFESQKKVFKTFLCFV